MESDDEVLTSADTIDLSKIVELNSLPEKSRKLYEQTYKKFLDYLAEKKIESYSENVLLTYFLQLAENVKSSTLWSVYSMLKTTLIVNKNVDISKYTKLKLYLKRKADGYQAKKSPVFNREQIEKFLSEAPDDKFLSTKVALIIGVAGACRNQELLQIKVNNIDDMTDKLLITLTDTVKTTKRSFLLTEYLDIYRKYAAARPAAMDTQRFFYKYTDGKAHRHSIGIHKLGKMPHDIAAFLKLPNAKEFTGHCFRRTAATLSVNASGGDVIRLKRYDGLQSSMDAEGFNTDYVKQEIDIDTDIS